MQQGPCGERKSIEKDEYSGNKNAYCILREYNTYSTEPNY